MNTADMPLLAHLSELRTRIFRILIGTFIAFLACYGVSDLIFTELIRPLVDIMPKDTKLIYTALPEAFFVYLKVSLLAAVVVSSPYIFYQIWAFIAPGLYSHEKKYIIPLALVSALFFISGTAFCYYIVFPFAFSFFISYNTEYVSAMPAIGEYLSFVIKILLAFGLIFEMPIFAFFLTRMGLINAKMMRRVRKYAILVVFIVAAILTPPDIFSQILMACPMIVLYEISIIVSALVAKKEKDIEDEDNDNELTPSED